MTHLTPPERETVILSSDADDHWKIWTAQRPLITRLKKNPAATLVNEGAHGSSAWAEFTLPAALLSFRSIRRTRTLTDEQRREAADRLRRAKERS